MFLCSEEHGLKSSEEHGIKSSEEHGLKSSEEHGITPSEEHGLPSSEEHFSNLQWDLRTMFLSRFETCSSEDVRPCFPEDLRLDHVVLKI
jgi:hypothetical protein